MASEVPTHELSVLVTCGLYIFNWIFTKEPLNIRKIVQGVIQMVPIKVIKLFSNLSLYFPLIVCFKHKIMLGHFDPKNAYLELADPVCYLI